MSTDETRGPGLVEDPGQAVEGHAGPVPPRRDHSVRRTATIDMLWPDGPGGRLHLRGRARDVFTHAAEEEPVVVRTASMDAIVRNRVIEEITTDPCPAGIASLVGERGGGHLRAALARFVPDERNTESPLYLLLDDISGTSLIGGVVWSRWPEMSNWPPAREAPGKDGAREAPDKDRAREAPDKDRAREAPDAGRGRGAPDAGRGRGAPDMEGVCIGFRPGSSALVEISERPGPPRVRPVGDLVNPADPHGWHELPGIPPTSTRRARFIDVHLDDGKILVESGFQDSVGDPDFGRVGVHEYRIHATADAATGVLESLTPVAHILPFRECPSAVAASQAILGAPVAQLRDVVLDKLASTNGCTHLNDALRALAEVPVLVDELRTRHP